MPAETAPWYFAAGVIMVVGTRDAAGNPHVGRVAGARYTADGKLVVYLPLPESLVAVADITDNGEIAIGFARIADYRSLQIKGSDARLAPAEHDAAHVASYRAGMVDAFQVLGYARDMCERLWSRETVPVLFTPETRWDQTPGPTAGEKLP